LELVFIAVVGVLGLALVGFIRVLKLLFGGGSEDRRIEIPPAPAPLTRTEKLGIVWEVMGTRMPDDLREEYGRLRGWRPPPAASPPALEGAVAPAVDPAAARVTPPALDAVPPPEAPPAIEPQVAPQPQVEAGGRDDRPLAVAPDVEAAAAHAPHWLRSFLSFENTIFLLAACLVLGGTLYVVATTWGHVPGRWRHLFLEGVVLFYGSALLAASALLDRRLKLLAAARFLGATAGITTAGAAVVACAAFAQALVAGVIGTAVVAAVGALDARAVLRLEGQPGPAPLTFLMFGAALALLAAVGLAGAAHPAAAAALLVAAVLVGGPLWLSRVATPSIPLRALAGALPAAAILLAVGGWVPAPYIGPALVAAGGTLATVGASMMGPPAALTLVALPAVGLGLAGGDLPLSIATLVIGLVVALVRLRGLDAGPPAASERPLVSGLAAALFCGVAFLWARAGGLVGARLGAAAWAWNGAAALPFAVVPLFVSARRRPTAIWRPAAIGAAAGVGGGALAMALAPFPDLGLPSVAPGAAAAALVYTWAARERELLPAWVAAHAVGLLAVWMAGRAVAPTLATAAVASAALPLLLPRGAVHKLVATVVVPCALGVAVADGAPGAWLAALAAAYGLAHLARPVVPTDEPWSTRPLGPPALVGALALALLVANGAHAPLVALARWPLVLAAGVAPFVAWIAWRGGPAFLAIETAVGIAALALGGQGLLGLALATVLVVGRLPGAVPLAAAGLAPLAGLAIAQGGRPEPIAAALLVGGAATLARPGPKHDATPWYRWLGLPFIVGAALIAGFARAAARGPWLPPDLWAIVAAAALAPFAFAAWRGAPAYIRDEVVGGAALLAAAALVDAFDHDAGNPAAVRAAAGVLLALACGLVAALRLGGRASRAAWVAALLLAPVAVVPTGPSPLSLTPAFVALAAVTALGGVSKRLRASDVGAWALVAALVAVWWSLLALAKHFSTGAPPEHILPPLAIVTALFGVGVALDGPRFATASAAFQRGLALVALALAAAFVVAAGVLIGAPRPLDAALTLAALVFLATLALVIAFHARAGWPFYVAESALAAAYAYLRLRTPWLDGLGDWDGFVACVGGLLGLGAERALRGVRAGLGADESRVMATLLPLLSAFFLRATVPVTGIGTALAAAFLTVRARDRARPSYGWLAAVLANLSLVPLWARLDVHTPVAYALPAGVSLALLCDVYHERLGTYAAPLRTVASLLSFAATSWEMFQFQSVWPALALAATAVAAVLVGIHARARAYLSFGFAALVIDIVANLTRWGMHDRLVGGALGMASGVVLFALGVTVSRHKERALSRYRAVMTWPW
jgi:hypothetical protein